MQLNITSKEEKPLLSRTEIMADITFDSATPSKEKIKEKLATILKVDANLIVVKKVFNKFGEKRAGVSAFAYKNEKDMKTIEPKPKEKKGAKKEEAPAEAPKEEKEAPKKEEPKKEEKKEEPKKEGK